MATVLIPSAGSGSRLHGITSKFNKALVSVGDRPAITYVLDHFSKDDKIIICVGYAADTLKQVIKALYPDWNIQFVDVDKYSGEGSGPGYSIIKAREAIGDDPFIFMCNDTIIEDDLNDLERKCKEQNVSCIIVNHEEDKSSQYRHVVESNPNCYIEEKDGPSGLAYIGAAYVNDPAEFFGAYDENPELFVKCGEVVGLNALKKKVLYKTTTWEDTGNEDNLSKSRTSYPSKFNVLEKADERIYVYKDKVLKLHIDPTFISDRVERHESMSKALEMFENFKLPKLLHHDKNVYVYEFVEGEVLSNIKNDEVFKKLLGFFDVEKSLSNHRENVERCSFESYLDFYKTKSEKRLESYKQNTNLRGFKDVHRFINGRWCMPIYSILEGDIYWHQLYDYAMSTGLITARWHGDFHFENILYSAKDDTFYLLDWRQNCGSCMKTSGDIYYDICKLYHSFFIKDECIKNGEFNYTSWKSGEYEYTEFDANTTFYYNQLKSIFEQQMMLFEYDKDIIKLITAIIILNIAGCGHETKYSNLCYLMAQYMLNEDNTYIMKPLYSK